MNINGYNPYKKGFDMLVADIQRAEALDELAKPCWSFDHMSFDHVSFARSVLHAQDEELERLRKIEAAAVACSEHPVWNDDQFYGLMTELQRALRGEVGADKTANVEFSGTPAALSPEAPLERRVRPHWRKHARTNKARSGDFTRPPLRQMAKLLPAEKRV